MPTAQCIIRETATFTYLLLHIGCLFWPKFYFVQTVGHVSALVSQREPQPFGWSVGGHKWVQNNCWKQTGLEVNASLCVTRLSTCKSITIVPTLAHIRSKIKQLLKLAVACLLRTMRDHSSRKFLCPPWHHLVRYWSRPRQCKPLAADLGSTLKMQPGVIASTDAQLCNLSPDAILNVYLTTCDWHSSARHAQRITYTHNVEHMYETYRRTLWVRFHDARHCRPRFA